MPRISKYTIKQAGFFILMSMLFLIVSFQVQAQFRSDDKYGLRLGFDLSRIPVDYLNPYRTDIGINADVRIDSDLYIAAETGWNKTHLDNKPTLDYISSGYFLKAGVDYNVIKRQFPQESNIIYVGFRYGIARMERKIPQYQIDDPYWGNLDGSFKSKTLLPQWVEVVVGLKAEILNNLFLGWSLHTRILVTQNVDKQVRPYLIPGFGKAQHNAVFDVNYTISYRIPLWKPKPKPPKEKVSKETAKPAKEADKKLTPNTEEKKQEEK